jgi:hypothetical protein
MWSIIADDGREVELLDRLHTEGDHAEHDADRSALHERVDAEPPQPGNGVREVHLVVLLEVGALARRGDVLEDAIEVLGKEPVAALERHEGAIHAEHRRKPRLQMDVRSVSLDRNSEDVIEFHVRHPVFAGRWRGTPARRQGARLRAPSPARCARLWRLNRLKAPIS